MRRAFGEAARCVGMAVVAAAGLGFGLGLTDCASPDCAETATCQAADGEAEGAADESSLDARPDATMDAADAADVTVVDDAAEGDATPTDASEGEPGDLAVDAPEGAIGDEADALAPDAGDASDAAVPVDAGAEVGPGDGSPDRADAHFDACSSAEICTDGIDNNCNMKTDCADPACSAFTCVPPIPDFWTGPAMLWTAPFSGTTPPSCPVGFSAFDLYGGPTGANGACSCTCTPKGQQCSGSLTLYTDQACQFSCATAALASAACTPVTGCHGNQGSMQASAVNPVGGTCTGVASMTPGPSPSFSSRARLCTFVGQADSPGGCGTGQQCLVAPIAPFGTSVCVYRSGVQPACPAPYDAGTPTVLYAGESDTRGCAPCTCSATPSGGTCGGSINVSGGSCQAPFATYSGSGCKPFAVSPFPASVQPALSLSAPGTCSLLAPSQATGGVTGTGPVSVCCL